MSKLKIKDIRNLSLGELDLKKHALEKELQDYRQKKIVGQLDKPHFFKQIRKQIAQVNTIKREMKNV